MLASVTEDGTLQSGIIVNVVATSLNNGFTGGICFAKLDRSVIDTVRYENNQVIRTTMLRVLPSEPQTSTTFNDVYFLWLNLLNLFGGGGFTNGSFGPVWQGAGGSSGNGGGGSTGSGAGATGGGPTSTNHGTPIYPTAGGEFRDLSAPVNIPDAPIISNGIDVQDITVIPVGTSRKIAESPDRGNTEDMSHGTNGDGIGINSVAQSFSDNWNFSTMDNLFYLCTILDVSLYGSNLYDVGKDMINKFKSRTGGTYTNNTLDERVSASSALINYLKRFGDQLNTSSKLLVEI